MKHTHKLYEIQMLYKFLYLTNFINQLICNDYCWLKRISDILQNINFLFRLYNTYFHCAMLLSKIIESQQLLTQIKTNTKIKV